MVKTNTKIEIEDKGVLTTNRLKEKLSLVGVQSGWL